VAHLCLQLGTSREELNKICSGIGYYYRRFIIQRNGKSRQIAEPLHRLREILNRLNRLLQRLVLPEAVKAGKKGQSNISNAQSHIGKPMLLTLDLRDFFPSISNRRVYRMFIQRCKCSPDVARYLTRLTTLDGQVPQGSPTSTIIAALVSERMVRRLQGLAVQHQASYTQYVDDGSISGPKHIKRILSTAANIVANEGFRVHPRKLRSIAESEEQVVTGVRVDSRLSAPSKKVTEVKELLDQLEAKGGAAHSKQRLASSLLGKIEYIRRLDGEIGGGLLDRLKLATQRWERTAGD